SRLQGCLSVILTGYWFLRTNIYICLQFHNSVFHIRHTSPTILSRSSLALADFHLFKSLQNHLIGLQMLISIEEVEMKLVSFLSSNSLNSMKKE
ncbi:unnamed protein product, partial [Hymenolepis diminuta]